MDNIMKVNILKTIALGILSFAMLSCSSSDEFPLPEYYSQTASTKLGQQIIDGSAGYVNHVKTDSETKVVPGVTLFKMGYLNRNGHAMQMFMYKVSLGPVSVITTKAATESKVQLLTEQVAAVENQGKYLVQGAISCGGDLGKGNSFFAILNDGSAVCLPSSEYEGLKSKVKHGFSGTSHLLQDGYVLSQTDAATSARAAVGVSADGGEVFMVVVDGGDYFYSNGVTCADLANLMKGCGASDAIVLNTGNNVTAVWRNERSENLFDLLNKPSAKGVEAEIAGGLLIVQ